jgi:hypothetical protein
MRKIYFLALVMVFMATLAFAQATGTVSGMVRDTLDNPIIGASVNLMPFGGGHHDYYHASTDSTGAFLMKMWKPVHIAPWPTKDIIIETLTV